MDGKLPALPGETPTMGDWTDHLSTLFPEVRLKRFLEMRGADGGPWSRLCALPALWVGLLYDATALDAAWSLCRDWTIAEMEGLRNGVPKLGLKAPFRKGTAQDLSRDMVAIAADGLRRRAIPDVTDVDETPYLDELKDIAELGITPAERLLDRYHTVWGGDIDKLYDEESVLKAL